MMRLIVLCTALTVATVTTLTVGDPKLALTLRLDQDISPDGAYQWAYETENGIAAQADGALKQVGNDAAVAAKGSFSYTSPEGELIQINYLADENGFQPQGSHIPTPPPIPETIVRALAFIAAHPEPALVKGL